MSRPAPERFVVLDDDPTGTQAVAGVRVLTRWTAARVSALLGTEPHAVHLLTNSRALPGPAAEIVTAAAAAAAPPDATIVLRGDSTLRGHLLEEYRAVTGVRDSGDERFRAGREGRGPAAPPPVLVLVPALPAAGRVTVDGVHWLLAPDGTRTALSDTEYARDRDFAYSSSRLLEWAQERSGGILAESDGIELPLSELRRRGAEAMSGAIAAAARSGRPAVCAPDAETLSDLRLIGTGVREAHERGVPLLVRCAPTFAGVLCGTLAPAEVVLPASGDRGVLIICGSYVSGTTAQLVNLRETLGITAVEPEAEALAGDTATAGSEVARVVAEAERRLAATGVALVATPRERSAALTDLDSGARIAAGLAAIVRAVEPAPEVVLAKGGITSQIVLTDGLGADEALVEGPVAPGVALWRVRDVAGRARRLLVFPGNVGGPAALSDVVGSMLGR